MKLAPMIIEDQLSFEMHNKTRNTVRAVIINQHQEVLMVYSKLFDDYTFPGGGIKHHENDQMALRRELNEELGAIEIIINRYLGYIEELRFGLQNDEQIYLQTSRYYQVNLIKTGVPSLIEREILHGLEARWIRIDDAIKHNIKVWHDEKHQQKGLKTVLLSENAVLDKIKEILNYEKV